jgi:hypothetical protein
MAVNNIVCLGSSGTAGYKITIGETWPLQLKSLLSEDYEVRNMAVPGMAISGMLEIILLAEKKYNPCLYIIQLPPPNRFYLGLNGNGLIREEDYDNEVVLGLKKNEHGVRVSPTRVHLNTGISKRDSPFFKFIKDYMYQILYKNNKKSSYESLLNFVDFFSENIFGSNVHLFQYYKEVLLLVLFLKNIRKKVLFFDWFMESFLKLDMVNIHNLHINRSYFIKEGKFTAYSYLNKFFPEKIENLTIDNYGHLNKEGNFLIAKEFLLKDVKKVLLKK